MTVEGFGRFQEPTRIEFAPVTFLIGPNGAGKSTVSRVLGILREALHETGAPHSGMEAGERFLVWFEFAELIAPAGLQLGLQLTYNTKPRVSEISIGMNNRFAINFKYTPHSGQYYDFSPVVEHQQYYKLADEHKEGMPIYNKSEYHITHGDDYYNIKELDMAILNDLSLLDDLTGLNAIWQEAAASITSNEVKEANSTGVIAVTTSRPAFNNSDDNILKMPSVSSSLTQPPIRDFIDGIANWNDINTYFEAYEASSPVKLAIQRFLITTKDLVTNHNYDKQLERYNQLTCAAQMLIKAASLKHIVSDFVSEFESAAPFKLAQRVQDDFLHHPPNRETNRLQEFMRGSEAASTGDPFHTVFAAAPFTNEFIKTFGATFGFRALGVKTVDGMLHRLIAYNGREAIPLIRLGSGLKILLSIYCWVLGAARGYSFRGMNERIFEYDLNEGKAPAKDEPPSLQHATDFPVVDFKPWGLPITSLSIDELETNLHPSLQSKIFKLLIDAAFRFDESRIGYGMGVADEGFILFVGEEQTPEEKEAKNREKIQHKAELKAKQHRAAELPYGQLHARCLIFETHSEYIIRTALTMVACGDYTPDMFAINYLHSAATQPVGEPPAYRINIRSNGTLDREFGPGFFDEAQRLKLELIELNRVQANQAN